MPVMPRGSQGPGQGGSRGGGAGAWRRGRERGWRDRSWCSEPDTGTSSLKRSRPGKRTDLRTGFRGSRQVAANSPYLARSTCALRVDRTGHLRLAPISRHGTLRVSGQPAGDGGHRVADLPTCEVVIGIRSCHLILSRVAVLPVGRTLRVHLALHVAVDLTWHFHTLISGCG
jgi:hypothetical protein